MGDKKEKAIKILAALALISAGFFCIQSALAQDKININAATLEELDTLSGIGPSKAQAIIDYRNANGPFKAIEEIINVFGIGPTTFENIKELIAVDDVLPIDEKQEGDNDTPPLPSPSQGEGESYSLGSVVINEFVSDPADGEVEWIELYNALNKTVVLTGWTIEEGSGAKTDLTGEIGYSGESRFFVVEKPKGNLNNKGDIVILRDNSGKLIDQVSFGDWDDGDETNNASAPADPSSGARKIDGLNSFNNANDFAVSITPTKGKSNIITIKEEEEMEELKAGEYDYSKDVVISEIFPNPEKNESEEEFIELHNKGERDVNLFGWKFGDESKKRYEFKDNGPAAVIGAGKYLAVYRKESKIALNNSGDKVKLYQPGKDNPLEEVKYEKAAADWSYAKADNGEWRWSETLTPSEKNIIKTVNRAPDVQFDCPDEALIGAPIIFDSSDTTDEDGDELSFSWDFGDGFVNSLSSPQHTYLKSGVYSVKLVVSDKENKTSKEKIIRVVAVLGVEADGDFFNLLSDDESERVVINEILPSPEGKDADEEFIEIKNIGQSEVNLINWKLDDSEGGSKPYSLIEDFFLPPGGFYLVNRPESGITLNNTSDAVRLYDDFGELTDEIEYEAAFKGESYARTADGGWFWTTAISPGEENIISAPQSKVKAQSGKKQKGSYVAETALEKIKDFDSGDFVKVRGKVAVLPGVFGTQYFYIVGSPRIGAVEAGSAGVQVYSYKKDFPELKVGDLAEVTGEISSVNGEKRIKTKTAEDIVIIEQGEEPQAVETSCDNLNEESAGQLVKIAGEVTEIKSSIVYLDDGLDEAGVYVKKYTGINLKAFKPGDRAAVVGIVGLAKSGPRVMPRSVDDIEINGYKLSASGRILGETAESDEWEVEARDKKREMLKYGIIIIIAIAGTFIGLLTRKMMRSKNKE